MTDYTELTDIINNAENIVFFGGAGVSTESGIPDFRGNDGLYNEVNNYEYSPEEMLHYRFLMSRPGEFYSYYRQNMIHTEALPNAAHFFLAELEAKGKLSAVITQNIDGLHQKAGSKNVIELHGSVLRNYCTRCGEKYGVDKITGTSDIPTCDKCKGLIRPDVVLYGEALNSENICNAEEAIENADVLIVGGTSLTVYPAAGLVSGFNGEHFIIINSTPTTYDGLAEIIIRDPIGEVFESIKRSLDH